MMRFVAQQKLADVSVMYVAFNVLMMKAVSASDTSADILRDYMAQHPRR
jgi:hypothetical protein